MRAQDVMSSPVVVLRQDLPVKQAAAVLADKGFTSAPVVDEDGRLIGMVTEADVLRDRVPVDPRSRIWGAVTKQAQPAATVGEVMSTPAVAIPPGTDCSAIARMMLDDHVRSMPVVDGAEVVGIVTRRDLLRVIAREDAVIRSAVCSRLADYGGADRWTVTVQDGVVHIIDDLDDDTDRHVAQIIAEAVLGVVRVEVASRTSRSTP
ncbi:CBS domain-containing protein [Kutzneria viridogrisea]|uniref:CBS domain-containing protein n=2 Tax=Kutzneria TaxID=43356 RepID=W5W3T7_9PSEU|nr:CBS domain-containing protein [Kutzneria albida]AHH95888.1 hypothetical protein KALB_2520 [Kutzneria albida DSM 43870]MBA8928912.1 CBS domain-containing protein [Kutzneria viridogrisea]